MEKNNENLDFIQSACNPIAVINTLAAWTMAARNNGADFEAIKNDPHLLGLLGKLCDLFKLDLTSEACDRAYQYLNTAKTL